MTSKIISTFIPRKSQWVMLALVFVWSLAQPLAVMSAVPIELRYELFFWKNILGLVIIAFGIFVILANLSLRRKPLINKQLFLLSLPFPLFSLFNMLFWGNGTSIQEQILYFLWPMTLFIIFPAFFPTPDEQRKAIFVIWLANLMALIYGIVPYAGEENTINWLDYQYRVDFGFLQPNIYAASWAVVFATSFYFYLTSRNARPKKALLLLSFSALGFIFLARSESVLLFCLVILIVLFFTEVKLDWRLRAGLISLAIAILVASFTNLLFDPARLNEIISGRIDVWSRAWELNMGDNNVLDYIAGRGSLLPGNLHYTGKRSGFQAMRAQSDNVYLAKFFQNGLIGLGLFLVPLIATVIHIYRRYAQTTTELSRRLYAWTLGVWVGIFLQSMSLDVIPSFGNTLNILLMVATAVAMGQGVLPRVEMQVAGQCNSSPPHSVLIRGT